MPVRITELDITEEAFDTNLNPIRAKVCLAMRVLTVNDLGFLNPAGALFMIYQTRRRRWRSPTPSRRAGSARPRACLP